MPFPSYSAGDLTAIRAGTSHLFYAINCNLGAVYTGTPSANASGTDNAEITMTTTVTNALINATVVVVKNGEALSAVKNLPEDEVLFTYVRKAASGTTLYIGRTSFQWTTSSRVYVLAEFRPQQIPSLTSGSEVKKNFDISFRPPLPRIYGVYAHVVLTTGTTANYQPSPSAEAMASGASISSWSWNKIAPNGTVSTAISAVQSPNLTLDVGVNWLQVQVTDNGSRVSRLAFPVVVVNTDFDATVRLSDQSLQIDRDIDSGADASFTALANWSGVLIGSPILTIAYNIYHDGTSSADADVIHFGYSNEWNDARLVDNETGYQWETQVNVTGIAGVMALLSVPPFQLEEVASPSTWSTSVELAVLTCKAAAWFMLSEHTTVPSVASIGFFSTADNYRFGVIQSPSGNLWDALNTLMFRNTAKAEVSANGEITYNQDGSYLLSSSDRNGLTTTVTFATTDMLEAVALRQSYAPTIRQIYSGAASYSTSTKDALVFEAHAEAGYYAAPFRLTFNGNILADDLSVADAKEDAGLLAYNFRAYTADVDTLDFSVLGGFLTLVPRIGEWVKFSFAATDFNSGIVWESSTRWQITSVSFAHDDAIGQIVPRVSVRKETGGQANYAIYSALLDLSLFAPSLILPVGAPYYGDLSDYYVGYTEGMQNYPDYSQPEPTRPATQNPREGETLVNVPMSASTVIQSGVTMVDGTTYKLDISPTFGEIARAERTTYNFELGQYGWAVVRPNNDHTTVEGVYTSSVGYEDTLSTGSLAGQPFRRRGSWIGLIFPTTVTLARVSLADFDLTKGSYNFGSANAYGIRLFPDITAAPPTGVPTGTDQIASEVVYTSATNGSNKTYTWTGSATGKYLQVYVRSGALNNSTSDPGGSTLIRTVEVDLENSLLADAISYWRVGQMNQTKFDTGYGLLVNGTDLSGGNIPASGGRSDHKYTAYYTAQPADNGNVMTLQFSDPDGDYSNNSDTFFTVKISAI